MRGAQGREGRTHTPRTSPRPLRAFSAVSVISAERGLQGFCKPSVHAHGQTRLDGRASAVSQLAESTGEFA